MPTTRRRTSFPLPPNFLLVFSPSSHFLLSRFLSHQLMSHSEKASILPPSLPPSLPRFRSPPLSEPPPVAHVSGSLSVSPPPLSSNIYAHTHTLRSKIPPRSDVCNIESILDFWDYNRTLLELDQDIITTINTPGRTTRRGLPLSLGSNLGGISCASGSVFDRAEMKCGGDAQIVSNV